MHDTTLHACIIFYSTVCVCVCVYLGGFQYFAITDNVSKNGLVHTYFHILEYIIRVNS